MASKLERELQDPFKKAGCDRVVVYTPEVLRSALFNAIGSCALDDVKLCVERGASVEWRDAGEASCGLTALQVAICSSSSACGADAKLATIRYLLLEGVDINAIDYVESTALHCAAAVGDARAVDLLLKSGANPKAFDAEALTPLHIACNNGHLPCVRALLNNWAPVDASDAQVVEAEKDKQDKFKRVASPGASLYIARRGAALHVCAATGRIAAARYLLERGHADVNNAQGPHGCTPLHIACRAGNLEMSRLLLDHDADPHARDDSGEQPLHRCVECGDLATCELLLSAGADVRSRNEAGLTPLHIAAAFARCAFFEPLVRAGADPNAPCNKVYDDWDGERTPMHYSAHRGDLECFKALENLGGDSRKLSAVGWPALFYAVEANNVELVEHIGEADLKDGVYCLAGKGRTPLMLAAMQGALEASEVLLRLFPFTTNMCDEGGRTALHWAAVRGEAEVMSEIQKAGGDMRARCREGKTCRDVFSHEVRPPPRRQWEEERCGPHGEPVWNYRAIMESTMLRYMKKVRVARQTREIAKERQCAWCERYSFDARRCAACKQVFYCSADCQRNDWHQGGHRLRCVTRGLEDLVHKEMVKRRSQEQ